MIRLLTLISLSAVLAFSQTTTSLDGTVTDPQGAVVVGASIQVTQTETGQTFRTTADERGRWVIPSMGAGVYRVSITMKGFRNLAIDNVKIDAGVPSTVNGTLEIGAVTETVEVSAGASLVQSTSATVSSTLQGRQVTDLPFTSRNALELIVNQPGTQTNTTARGSFINGLPLSAINITTDGINTQDNFGKSNDGFFTLIPVKTDSVEEVTLSSAAAGADSLGQGAAAIKFVTKGGTNQFHGGAFWQHRNSVFNANYYYNTIDGLPRDVLILNQLGVHVGGPIKKNKLFFFTNYEIFRYPSSTSATRTVLTPSALSGNFTYLDSARNVKSVNVLDLAASKGYVGTQDPIVQRTLQQINSLIPNGTTRSLIPSSNDYNRQSLIFQPKGLSKSNYDTARLDYNITDKHALQVVYTITNNNSAPDITNSVVPIYPGTGTVLGFDGLIAGQRGNRYAGVVALRSSLTPAITNQFRAGMNQAITLFRDQISSTALFEQWRGFSPSLGAGYITGVASVSGSSRRKSPVKEIHDDFSWVKGPHLISVGMSFSQISLWQQTLDTNTIPSITFGIATNDPINTGTTSIFTTANFPGAVQADLTNAGNLYALLTGRVSSIGRAVALNGETHKYAPGPEIDLNRQREYGFYVQDTWRTTRSLTLTLGLRIEKQGTFENQDHTYSSASLASIWGISGIGNLFKPNTLTGVRPTFMPYNQDYTTPAVYAPSFGLAYQLPGAKGPLGWLLGQTRGRSVFRGGYSIATIREATSAFTNTYSANQGLRADVSVTPGTFPQFFGAPGSVLFRQATLPSRPAPDSPQYPITAVTTDSVNGFDPNLKMGYVQSWNIGFQRELGKDMVVEVRFTGNHGLKEWRRFNLNEVNTFENGFQKEFYNALSNLQIARRTTPTSTNFGNQGLAGQVAVPLLQTALGTTTDTTIANNLLRNQVGAAANSISGNATRMGNLVRAGYPVNFFVVNPDVVNGGAFLTTNAGSSFYDALQIEVRRRMSKGLLFQGSYVWGHSIINGASSSATDTSQPSTLRNLRLDRVDSGFDIRHAFKVNSIYELPFGPGHALFSSSNPIVKKLAQGWQIAGISRVQSGVPFSLGGSSTLTNNDTSSAVLYNMTGDQLQDLVKIRKTTGANGVGLVYYLPDDFIANTNAAWEVNGKTLANLDPTKPYIGRQLTPGQFGYRLTLRNPWQYHLDLSVIKHTKIGERFDVELRAQALNALNITNFYLANNATNAAFGTTRTAFRDFSGTNDPGARIIEFQLRVNF